VQIGFLRLVIFSSPVTQSSRFLILFQVAAGLFVALISLFPDRSRAE
jgi:hypothetical protein